ncbi:12524_t:CDS:2, partial [Entrophospora sp. SA101]
PLTKSKVFITKREQKDEHDEHEEIIDILKASGKILNEEGRLKNENSLKFLQKIIGSTDLASELDQVEVYYDSGQKYGVEEFDGENLQELGIWMEIETLNEQR